MAKTTLAGLEERTQWCAYEFARQSLFGGVAGLLVSLIAFKNHAAVGLYGAGLGGGYAAFSCSRSFDSLKPAEKPAKTPDAAPPKEAKFTEEQERLVEALTMLSAIKEK